VRVHLQLIPVLDLRTAVGSVDVAFLEGHGIGDYPENPRTSSNRGFTADIRNENLEQRLVDANPTRRAARRRARRADAGKRAAMSSPHRAGGSSSTNAPWILGVPPAD